MISGESTSNYTNIFVRYSKIFRNEKKIVAPIAQKFITRNQNFFAELGVKIKLLPV